MLNKLAMGMSRNMVIRNALNRVTTEEVTEHVDHVHQLKVVQSLWRDYDLYLSTNSITGASLARLCLLSRQKYKVVASHFEPLSFISTNIHRTSASSGIPMSVLLHFLSQP